MFSDAYCKGTYLQNLLAPTFLTTDMEISDVVPAGVYIHYTCSDEQNKGFNWRHFSPVSIN